MATLTREEWTERAAQVKPIGDAFIDGSFAPAVSGKSRDCVNPATGKTIAQVAACGSEDVDRAVAAARRSFEAGVWSEVAPGERKTILLRFAELVAENTEQIGLLISLEMGKLVQEAVGIEIPLAAQVAQWHAEATDKVYGEIAPTGPGDLALISREPLGVVGAIVPWNFPVNLAMWKVAPALAAGNSVVLKPASPTPLSALRVAELAAEAGIPAGVYNVVPGAAADVGQPLAQHGDVDCLSFTGSTAVGRELLHYAADSNLKQVWLELGGKSPNLVFADQPDLDTVAQFACMGIFFNQGEVCSANSRLLVEEAVKDELLEKIVANVNGIVPGDPLDPKSTMGALVDQEHTDTVMGHIEAGRQQAELVQGGEQVFVNGSGCFVEPTVFDGVEADARLAQEEIFGPVLSVIPFKDEQEAVKIANSTIYGLGASIWTTDLSRAHRLSRRLKVGTVSVNTVDALSPQTPFGGVKQSGSGRDLSLHALDKYTALKTTWIKY